MTRFLVGLLALALMILPASAQMTMRGVGGGGMGGGGAAAPTWTKKAGPAVQALAYSSGDFADFASVAINNASTSDLVVVFVSNSNRYTTGVTIDGNAMTPVVESNASGGGASIWKYTGATFTTPTIRVSSAAALNFVAMSVGVLTGVNPAQTDTAILPVGAGPNPQVTTSQLDVPSTGFGLAVYFHGAGATGVAWDSPAAEDYDVSSGTDHTHSSAYITATTTPSVTGAAYAGNAIAAAAWGP